MNGNPAITYYDQTNNDLKYVRATDPSGSSWSTPVIIDAVGGDYLSLKIVNGNPAVSYTSGPLKYIRAIDASGTTWGTPIILDAASSVQRSSLQIVNGNPAIAYHDAYYPPFDPNFGRDLKYIRASDESGTAWGSPNTIDDGDVGGFVSLQIINGNPAVAYMTNSNDGDLAYMRAIDETGNNWGTPIILDNDVNVGYFTSLQTVNGNPAICYADLGNGDLKYVRSADATGTTWGTALIFDAAGIEGEQLSLQIVNGNPAISYYHNGFNTFGEGMGDLKYVRAENASGTAWGTPVTPDAGERIGQLSSLQIVNGNPAISYSDVINNSLKYVRATDALGTAWGTPVVVDASGYQLGGCVLAIVNGYPAIAYSASPSHTSESSIKFVRATDISGTAWGNPISIDTGFVNSLNFKIVKDNPAIIYGGNNGLQYARATDASGTGWGTPVILDALGGNFSSIQIVNGNPAVLYTYNNKLQYIRANDAFGTTWGSPVTLHADASGLGAGFLEVVNGYPAVAYYSTNPNGLAYIQATDSSGINWGPSLTLVSERDYIANINLINTPQGAAIAYYSRSEALPYFISGTVTLPLTLLEFKGRLQESAVNLQWVTSDEVNTKEFVIERRNQNTTFTAIGKVFAQSTAGTHQYSFTDTKPLGGKNFYRLKMTDKDGNFTYSRIVPIKINDAVFTLSAYPNPVKNILNIKTSSTGNNKITIHVTDLTGKLLLNKVTNKGNGESIISLNVSQLSSGNYFLKILSADGKENAVKKFVKQ